MPYGLKSIFEIAKLPAAPTEMDDRVAQALHKECLAIFGSTWSNDTAWRFARAAIAVMKPRVRVKMGSNVVSVKDYRSQCRKKKKHDTVQQAFAAMVAHHGNRPEFNVYECPHCRKWHVGHRERVAA